MTDAASQTRVLKTEGLTKSFGDHLVLRGIDLEVKEGESVVIFGPNGAGKTTLIKILAAIMNPSSGSVLIYGLDLKDRAEEARRRIGVVTHHTFLYRNLTAYENLDFYSRLYDVPNRDQRILDVAAIVGMTSRLHHRLGTLSRGMQQRLSIARSLLHSPAIMLLDEPETGLDQEAIAMLWDALQTQEGVRRTIILTTHNLERGLEKSERVLILDKGRIVYQGSSDTLDISSLEKVYRQSTVTEV